MMGTMGRLWLAAALAALALGCGGEESQPAGAGAPGSPAAGAEAKDPAASFGSNVAGIILGGLSEYLSLVLGFNYLLLVAIGYYALSAVLGPRLKTPLPAPAPVAATA